MKIFDVWPVRAFINFVLLTGFVFVFVALQIYDLGFIGREENEGK